LRTKPYVICHMIASLDGGLHPSRWTKSPDSDRQAWSLAYECIHQSLDGDAWMVGRVTMAELSKAGPHPPALVGLVERPYHFVSHDAKTHAIAVDPKGKLHFSAPDIGGDHVVVLLGRDIADAHLAELTADGISYIVTSEEPMDLAKTLDLIGRELGIKRLLLEGGAGINGSFFAAGLVDELSLLIAPALDGQINGQRFVEFGEIGLSGKVALSLISCERIEGGLLHLRYTADALSPIYEFQA